MSPLRSFRSLTVDCCSTFGQRSVVAAVVALGLMAPFSGGQAQTTSPDRPIPGGQPTLLVSFWYTLPQFSEVAWPYSYLRLRDTNDEFREARRELLAELRRVIAQFEYRGNDEAVRSIEEWIERVQSIDKARVPGRWDPSALLEEPHRAPPISEVRAVGACAIPLSVGVWSIEGADQLPWTDDLTLSTLLDRRPELTQTDRAWISVVRPTGEVEEYGIEAWNFADTPLNPGDQVVGTLPFGGEAFPWIRRRLARILAQALPGNDCREAALGSVDVSEVEEPREASE